MVVGVGLFRLYFFLVVVSVAEASVVCCSRSSSFASGLFWFSGRRRLSLSTQQRIDGLGHCTSWRTSSQIRLVIAWMHLPGQSSTSAVLVIWPSKPEIVGQCYAEVTNMMTPNQIIILQPLELDNPFRTFNVSSPSKLHCLSAAHVIRPKFLVPFCS